MRRLSVRMVGMVGQRMAPIAMMSASRMSPNPVLRQAGPGDRLSIMLAIDAYRTRL
jgi:hypothetical protein